MIYIIGYFVGCISFAFVCGLCGVDDDNVFFVSLLWPIILIVFPIALVFEFGKSLGRKK